MVGEERTERQQDLQYLCHNAHGTGGNMEKQSLVMETKHALGCAWQDMKKYPLIISDKEVSKMHQENFEKDEEGYVVLEEEPTLWETLGLDQLPTSEDFDIGL